jgi:hypothetical protein
VCTRGRRKAGSLPDHKLVVAATINMIWIRGRKDIVCNVAAHVIDIVLPLDRCWHALDLADQVTFIEDAACISIALDVIFGSGPCPLGAPFDARARSAVVVSAL